MWEKAVTRVVVLCKCRIETWFVNSGKNLLNRVNDAGFPNMKAAKKGRIQFLTKEYFEKRCAGPLILSSPISLITAFMNTINASRRLERCRSSSS